MERRTWTTIAGTLITALLITMPAKAQDGPKYFLNATAVDPNDPAIVYTSSGGIWKSADSGATWTKVDHRAGVWSLEISSPSTENEPAAVQVIYAATREDGVLWSTDSETWTKGSGISSRVAAIAAHPDGDTAFAGAEDAIYVSRDRGENWEVLPTDVGTGATTGLVIDPANPLVMYAAKQGQGVYRSVDGGLGWQLGNNGLTNWNADDLDLHPQNPSMLYVTTYSGVFRSADAGMNWEALDTPTRTTELDIDPTNPDRMIVTTRENGILRSLNGGQTWQPINTGLGDVVEFVSIAIAGDGSGVVYAGSSENGLFTSLDFGDTWSQNYILPETERPRPASPPPPPPTSLDVQIVNRNGEKVVYGEAAVFNVIVRNSGPNLSQNTEVSVSWAQIDKGPYAMTARLSGGSCEGSFCSLGDLPVNGEVVIVVEGYTGDAYNWRGPYSLLATAHADNAEWSRASIRVGVTFSAEGGGGATGPALLALLFLLALVRNAWQPASALPSGVSITVPLTNISRRSQDSA